jgi:hypothetical protein
MRWLGRVSYSLYLWHWPAIVLMTVSSTGLSGTSLLLCRLGAMLAATCISFYLIENPLRRADWSAWWRRSLAGVGVATTGAIVLVATVTPAGAGTAIVSAATSRSLSSLAAIGTATHPLPEGRVPTRQAPARVWLFGDSVMNASSPGITAAVDATGNASVVLDSSTGGWGLTSDPRWPADETQTIATDHPEIAIGTWSWDNASAASNPSAYAKTLRAAIASLLAPGDGIDLVVLLQFPRVGPDPYLYVPSYRKEYLNSVTVEQNAWDRIAEHVVTEFPGHALFIPSQQLFAPNGRFLTWMRTASGKWVRARSFDNIHMCPYGAALFGELVVDYLRPTLDLGPLKPGWQVGSWVKSPVFSDPPGACTNDQPPPGYRGVPVATPVAHKTSAAAGAHR